MTREIRPSTPADAPAIASLVAEAGLNPNVEPAQLHWKYWQERADWPGARSYVLTNGTQLLAHAGLVPGVCTWGAQRVTVLHLIDWAARRDAMGAGVAVMKHVGRLADALFGVGGSEQTRRILPHVGFRTLGNATEYFCGLYPLRHARVNINPLWKWPPRLARSLAWTWSTRTGRGSWRARCIAADELHALAGHWPVSRNGAPVFERSPALLSYFLGCPIAPMKIYALEQAHRLRGYFLLSFTGREARLADCWLDSDDPAAWRALIYCAIGAAGTSDCLTLTTLATEPLLSRCLLECGFRVHQTLPVQWLAADDMTPPGESMHLQMLDYDAAYLHHPKPREEADATSQRHTGQTGVSASAGSMS